MVLSFALCATFAFAQTNKATVVRNQHDLQKAAPVSLDALQGQQASYTGSIFTKDAGDLLYCEFSADNNGYSTGTVSNGDQINGTNAIAHTQTAYHSTWHRIADTTSATGRALVNSGNYGATYADNTDAGFLSGFTSQTPMNGLMMMTMQDQISQWGGTGSIGDFDAYIAFPAVATTGVPIFDVRFYQYYRCFNHDQCWIDYSTNGTTWSAVEINISSVDVAVNSSIMGWKNHTMPLSLANQASVYLRLRWSCDNNAGGAYGYIWILDDFRVIPGVNDRLTPSTAQYFEGFYQLVPQGLQLPMVWASDVTNTGANNQTNAHAALYTYAGNGAATLAATSANHSINSLAGDSLVIDPFGWYGTNTSYHGWGWDCGDASQNIPQGTKGYLPSQDTGIAFVYADIQSNAIQHVYGDTATFDTIGYHVNMGADGLNRVWGRDNGNLCKFSRYIYGKHQSGSSYYVSSDPDDISWNEANYSVWNTYVTGDVIPQGWTIRGMQLVVSTYPGFSEVGASIAADLRRDSVEDGSVWFKPVETGANVYTITANDVNSTTTMEYETFGNYNVVTIEFPEQPELLPNTAYRIGYTLVEDANFAVARNTNFYYDLIDSTAIGYAETPGMEAFAHTFGHDNYYSTLIYNPQITDASASAYCFANTAYYPMIRLLVGPWTYVSKYTVSFECGDNGEITNLDYETLCGQTDSAAQNSLRTFIAIPDEDYSVDKIYINGEEVDIDPEQNEEVRLQVTIDEPTTIRATFVYDPADEEGIDPIANGVAMNLQPNPATNNVQLSISGVNGTVDFALIDMSGRVIRTSRINAETTTNIDLSNVAKGAYFVRITNNNFTKVEKLIVR